MDETALSPLLRYGLPEEPLTGKEAVLLQRKLWGFLGYVTERYTMGESSSVTAEAAEELFRSLCFTLSLAVRTEDGGLKSLLRETDPRRLLEQGRRALEARVGAGKELYGRVVSTLPPFESVSCRDTVESLGGFFRRYDLRFFAHAIPADIDYQLCRPVPERLLGIEYVNEYLRRLLTENLFLSRFDAGTVRRLLERYCPDYRELLVNLYEPAAVNAVGLALCGGEVRSLDIGSADRERLGELFRVWSREDAASALADAAGRVCSDLSIRDEAVRGYLSEAARDLYPRIAAVLPHGGLGGIFLSLDV